MYYICQILGVPLGVKIMPARLVIQATIDPLQILIIMIVSRIKTLLF